jgi:16S rRNA (guanine966-N2)-methyltransferase
METKKLFTTIQAGKYKGKKLLLPSLERTRSTKSVLKGSFFDTFQYEIIDQHFVEVFGGSGSMGLEALSRGAKHAYFIEYDQKAFSTLKENCKSIDSNATTCYQGDAFKVLPTLLPSFTCKTIFYFDPPFSIREGMDEIYEKTLEVIAKIPPKCVHTVAIEHMTALSLPKSIGTLSLQKTKKFGKSSLSYYM